MWRLLALLALATAAHAETYKWVDEKGVVNYSNSPPPASAKKAQTVADRISTYETDPALQQATAYRGVSPYEMMAQQEWLQRQRSMAQARMQEAAYAPDDYMDYYPYGYGYCCAGRAIRPVRQVRPRVAHHSGVRRF
jgi:uncharacterized protein YbaP (TraB family)